jgi:hypothetical protein
MAAFDYLLSVTGDCSNNNSGAINISMSGGVPPYTIDFVTPNLGLGNLKTGLSSGFYLIRANDSLGDINNEFYINALVSSGGCLNVTNITHTTCGENNGEIILSGTSTAYPITISLFSGETLITTSQTFSSTLGFSNLAPGIYQAYYEDFGGCLGYSESIIINDSNNLDFDFFVVNDTQCFGNVGKLQITGLTGTAPFTYLWSDGSTGTTITGLTAGSYSVTVTDSGGCTKNKVGTVLNADTLSIAAITATNPTCFDADGTVTVFVTGGTAPYFYSGNNGTTLITYSQNVTFTGFTAGPVQFTVIDSTLCSAFGSTNIQMVAGFTVVTVQSSNSFCSSDGGSVSAEVLGNGPFTYVLVYPDSTSVSTTQLSPLITYNNLSAGTYSLIISNSGGCTIENEFTIFTVDKFSVNLQLTGSSCGGNNGICYVEIGSGYTGLLDFVLTKNNSPVIQYIDVPQTAATFNNLSSGTYQLQVRDELNCSIYRNFTIQPSSILDFNLFATNCGETSSGGTATVNVLSGTPPFTYLWSNGQTTPSISNLTGGTYSVKVTDTSGCTKTRSVVVPCTPLVTGYQVVPILSSGFTTTTNSERDFLSMVSEGFNDLTSGNTNCILTSAEYIAVIQVSGNTYEQSFYTGTTLNDVPSESLWVQTLESILSGITGISTYTIDATTNTVKVVSTCDGDVDVLSESEFILGLKIEYDIYCVT